MPEIVPIDALKLKRELCTVCGKTTECNGKCKAIRTVDNQPELDLQKPTEAYWILTRDSCMGTGECSNCGQWTIYWHGYKFCPRCGAKIKGVYWEDKEDEK